MRQIDNLKFMAMALLVALFSLSFTACSDDDEEVTSSITDYYMSCEVSGGNLSSSERTQMEAYWNSIFIEVSKEAWAAYTLDEALYAFDTTVKNYRNLWSSGYKDNPSFDYNYNISGTLYMKLQLRTETKVVKETTLALTEDSCE